MWHSIVHSAFLAVLQHVRSAMLHVSPFAHLSCILSQSLQKHPSLVSHMLSLSHVDGGISQSMQLMLHVPSLHR